MQQISLPEQKLSIGRWTKQQHQRFMYAIMQYGKDWKRVEQYVKTRSSSQVRSHAQKFFNKLQKATQNPQENTHTHTDINRRPQEFSETQFDIEREINNEQTPSTPMELVSFIRKQSKEEGGKISLSQLKKSLDEHEQKMDKPQQIQPEKEFLSKGNSFKSMSNILSAYEEVNSSKDTAEQDESFFISITKKYKRLFKDVQSFDRLIDLHQNSNDQHPQQFTRNRKRSFTLPEGNNLQQEQMQEKIESIKKKINEQVRGKAKGKERKDSDSSIQFMPPPLNKLTTIQEQPREEEENISFRAILSQEKLEDAQQT